MIRRIEIDLVVIVGQTRKKGMRRIIHPSSYYCHTVPLAAAKGFNLQHKIWKTTSKINSRLSRNLPDLLQFKLHNRAARLELKRVFGFLELRNRAICFPSRPSILFLFEPRFREKVEVLRDPQETKKKTHQSSGADSFQF